MKHEPVLGRPGQQLWPAPLPSRWVDGQEQVERPWHMSWTSQGVLGSDETVLLLGTWGVNSFGNLGGELLAFPLELWSFSPSTELWQQVKHNDEGRTHSQRWPASRNLPLCDGGWMLGGTVLEPNRCSQDGGNRTASTYLGLWHWSREAAAVRGH
eukprot:SAG11_NODE_2231_length_3658_cov_2.124754_3_plen_155_part_00